VIVANELEISIFSIQLFVGATRSTNMGGEQTNNAAELEEVRL
jgi:hypothetical protein